jgi:predicted esterase
MFQRLAFCLFLVICVSVNAATTVNVRGKVMNAAGNPVASAVVTLVRQGMKDTTGADGTYAITGPLVAVLPDIAPRTENVSLNNGILEFSLSNPSTVTLEFFDIKGNLLNKELLRNVRSGEYRLDIARKCRATSLQVIKARIGSQVMTFRYLPLRSGAFSVVSSGEYASPASSDGLAKMAASVDSVRATAAKFQTKTMAIASYDQELNITLDSAAAGNTGSIGCGKELSSIKSGTYTITSASLSRKYTINIPANYDKNKPYRMIFGMHCMGSSMGGVVNEKYYSLQPLATSANIPVIFVAPDGYSDGSPWRVSDNKDHTFFGDLLKLFKENLCVDTARIFCCGFSYGAMVSYSLSLAFQDQLRAVATYAPANWNIYLPTNTKKPIAYYQTTGTDDNLCSWINPSKPDKEGGKFCVLGHIEDNKCPTPATIPLATGGTHVSTLFPGCMEGYPVKFGSFKGGHACVATENGVNWIAKETWDFFMQF